MRLLFESYYPEKCRKPPFERILDGFTKKIFAIKRPYDMHYFAAFANSSGIKKSLRVAVETAYYVCRRFFPENDVEVRIASPSFFPHSNFHEGLVFFSRRDPRIMPLFLRPSDGVRDPVCEHLVVEKIVKGEIAAYNDWKQFPRSSVPPVSPKLRP